MELVLLGLLGQVVALRLLAIQLARTPDDPPLLRHRRPTATDRTRRARRHRRLVRAAVVAFLAATAVTGAGLVLLLR